MFGRIFVWNMNCEFITWNDGFDSDAWFFELKFSFVVLVAIQIVHWLLINSINIACTIQLLDIETATTETINHINEWRLQCTNRICTIFFIQCLVQAIDCINRFRIIYLCINVKMVNLNDITIKIDSKKMCHVLSGEQQTTVCLTEWLFDFKHSNKHYRYIYLSGKHRIPNEICFI